MNFKFLQSKLRLPPKRQSGFALLTSVIFFLFISLAITAGLVSPTVREVKIANDLWQSKKSNFLSESGLEDAYYRLKTGKPIGFSSVITLDGNTATTSITDSGYNEKTVTSLGNVALKQRNNQLILGTGAGVSFAYGIQAGTGGFQLGNAVINGNVYSNGTIEGVNGATITGSAFSVGTGGLVDNIDVGTSGVGDVRAHTVRNSTIAGNLYCQTGSGNNKTCNTSQPDPSPVAMPITQAMIDEWKTHAEAGGTTVGDVTVSAPMSLGPKVITGNLNINANLNITGTLYIMGNITTNNNAQVTLDSSYGPTGGIVLVDGRVILSNNVMFFGSGSSGSYVLLATTSACPTGCSGQNAIEVLNNVGAILIHAQNGTVHLNNNVELSEVVGNKIIVDNSAEVTYTTGLANTQFTTGPTGGWEIKSWKEIE